MNAKVRANNIRTCELRKAIAKPQPSCRRELIVNILTHCVRCCSIHKTAINNMGRDKQSTDKQRYAAKSFTPHTDKK